MVGSVNKVILIGNLGADPEIRNFPTGGRVCSLRIATSENWKDKNSGERKEKTEWHSISIFEENAISYAENYLSKGSKIYCEGKLETRKWQDQSGNDRYSTEICLRPISGKLIGLTRPENTTTQPPPFTVNTPTIENKHLDDVGDDVIPF